MLQKYTSKPDTDTSAASAIKPLRIALINPIFEPSYWGHNYALALFSSQVKCTMVTGAMPTLAALVKPPHTITLIDENIDVLDFEALAKFDIVGVTGMIVQRARIFEILAALAPLPCTVIAGGSYASVSPDEFIGHCDTLFEGEADTSFPEYLEAYATGAPVRSHYKQTTQTDMSKVPTPRYDLLKKGRYASAALQFSRGCPFRCEFCDIITIFGRRPRLKSPEQMLRELDEIHQNGFKVCFLVDDNFIGNKAKAKELLLEIIKWQEKHGYPLTISTEASLNVADDPEFLALMAKANFNSVFIGLESPREESLKETLKLQNTRAGTTEEKIQKVRDAGMLITAGFIVGFDNDDEQIFREQYEFISRIAVAKAAIAILTPIPTTPLYNRLNSEGRLKTLGQGLHFVPKQIDPQKLLSGYQKLRQDLYEPTAYFQRVFDSITQSKGYSEARAAMARRMQSGNRLKNALMSRLQSLVLFRRLRQELSKTKDGQAVFDTYKQQWRKNRRLQPDQQLNRAAFVSVCINHWHYYRIAHEVTSDYVGYSESAKAV